MKKSIYQHIETKFQLNSTQIEIWQSHYCDDKDRKNEQWRSRQRKHITQCECDVTHECRQEKQNSKKSQQNNSELWELVSSKTHENWENQQDFCSIKKIEAHYSHACLKHVIQTDNDNENTRYSFQLCWNIENENELYY